MAVNGTQVASIAAIELENVSTMIPELLRDETTLDSVIEDNGRAERVSNIAYRIPMKYARPGNYKSGSLDGTVLPTGKTSQWDKGSLSPQTIMLPIGFTKLTEMVGQKVDKVAVANVVAETVADAVDQMKIIRDQLLQTDGTGNIGVVSAVDTTNNIVTMASTPFGARLLSTGQTVGIWDGTTSLGSYASIDRVVNALGFTQSFHYAGADVASAAAGNIIRCDGLTDGAPVFVNGIKTFINTSTTGTVLGITKASAPYVVSNGYDLSGGQITLPALRLLINQVQSRLGKKGLKGQMWYTHPSQVAAYEELGFERQEVETDGKFKGLDLLFESFTIGGYPVLTSQHADQTAWYFIEPKSFGKVQYGDGPFWYDTGNGSKFYPLYDPTTGAPTTEFGATFVDAKNYYCANMLANGVITTAKVPSGN